MDSRKKGNEEWIITILTRVVFSERGVYSEYV